jgi:hypothetical protein
MPIVRGRKNKDGTEREQTVVAGRAGAEGARYLAHGRRVRARVSSESESLPPGSSAVCAAGWDLGGTAARWGFRYSSGEAEQRRGICGVVGPNRAEHPLGLGSCWLPFRGGRGPTESGRAPSGGPTGRRADAAGERYHDSYYVTARGHYLLLELRLCSVDARPNSRACAPHRAPSLLLHGQVCTAAGRRRPAPAHAYPLAALLPAHCLHATRQPARSSRCSTAI